MQFSSLSLVAAIVTGLVVAVASVCEAHPSDSWIAEQPPENYGGQGSLWSQRFCTGDLQFATEYPDASSLSQQESYIVAGAVDGSGQHYHSWYQEVYLLLSAYHGRHGSLPDSINEEVIRLALGETGAIPESTLNLYRSPLTNEYPRLDAEHHSPGDVYCRFLTESEMDHIATESKHYRELWVNGRQKDPATNTYREVYCAQPLYLRVYGWDGVILDGLQYICTPRN